MFKETVWYVYIWSIILVISSVSFAVSKQGPIVEQDLDQATVHEDVSKDKEARVGNVDYLDFFQGSH